MPEGVQEYTFYEAFPAYTYWSYRALPLDWITQMTAIHNRLATRRAELCTAASSTSGIPTDRLATADLL